MNNAFDLSAYLKKLAKIRKNVLSAYDLQEKLKITDYQIQQLENGNIHFLQYPYNYYITKQYIQIIDSSEIAKIKAEDFKIHTNNQIIQNNKNDDILNSRKNRKIKELKFKFKNWIKTNLDKSI